MDVFAATCSIYQTSRPCAAAARQLVKPNRVKSIGFGLETILNPRFTGCWKESYEMAAHLSREQGKPIPDLTSASCVTFWFSQGLRKRERTGNQLKRLAENETLSQAHDRIVSIILRGRAQHYESRICVYQLFRARYAMPGSYAFHNTLDHIQKSQLRGLPTPMYL